MRFESLITSSLSSQFEADDFAVLRSVILQPRLWFGTNEITVLENELKSYVGMPRAFSFFSGRGALYGILSVLNVPKDAEVLVPALTCAAAIAPVLWVGAKPVYVDIDRRTLNISTDDFARKITSKSRVVIVQHTFGLACEMDALLSIARHHKLFIIEDCAHALGTEYAGQKVGSFGDASFFSFGRDKVISGIFGGMALMREGEYAERLSRWCSRLKTPSRGFLLKILLQPFLTSFARRRYHIFSIGKFFLGALKRSRILQLAVEPGEKRGAQPSFLMLSLPNALAFLIRHQLRKLEFMNQHRAWVAERFQNAFQNFGKGKPSYRSLDGKGKHIFLRYALLHSDASFLLHRAQQHNIFIGDWHGSPLVPAGVSLSAFQFTPSQCPQASQVAKEVIPLPTHSQIREREIQRLVDIFFKTL